MLRKSSTASKHHKDSPTVTKKTHKMTEEIVGLLRQHNPFSREKPQLITVLSGKVSPDELMDALISIEETDKEDLLKYEEEGSGLCSKIHGNSFIVCLPRHLIRWARKPMFQSERRR